MWCALLCLVAQSCLTLCNPTDCRLPGSSVHGILQARTLEWVAMPSSRGSSQPRDQNPDLLHCRWLLYHLSHQGSPRILKWVACPFSRGSFQPRNWTSVSCISGYSKQILISFYFINYLILGLNISYFLINFLLFLAYWKLKDRAKDVSFLKARHLGIFLKKVWIKWKKLTY